MNAKRALGVSALVVAIGCGGIVGSGEAPANAATSTTTAPGPSFNGPSPIGLLLLPLRAARIGMFIARLSARAAQQAARQSPGNPQLPPPMPPAVPTP